MTDEFTVSKRVKLPEPNNKNNRPPKYPFNSMAVDTVFFIPDRTTSQMSTYASLQGRRLGKKFTTQMACMRRNLQTEEWELCKAGAPGSHNGVAVRRVS